jgi:LPXTG-motif cell wall-anchored protein
VDRSQHRRRRVSLVGTVLAIASVVGFPALNSAAAEPPFDTTLNESCALFGQGPEGVAVGKVVSVSGTGDIRTVDVRISWPGHSGEAEEVIDCIAVGNQATGVVRSVSQEFVTQTELSVTFSVGLAGTDADLNIAEGDRVCDIAVVYFTTAVGVSDVYCTDPITFATTTTTTGLGATPGPSTTRATTTTVATTTSIATTTTRPSTRPTLPATGRPHAGVVAGGVLALLAGAAALVLVRRST